MNPYEGKVCLVTGATSGNGLAVAKTLLRRGASKVYTLGRNHAKLWELEECGGTSLFCDFTNQDSIDEAAAAVLDGPPLDYLFHLAGNALHGPADAYQRGSFVRSDLLGPQHLIEGLLGHMNPGACMGIVTSGSAALGSIPTLRFYQKVKAEMVRWWHCHRAGWQAQGIYCTLISMGVVATDIWNRTEGISPVTRYLIPKVIPGANRWAQQILDDVAQRKLVSYPGRFSSLAPLDPWSGCYYPNPILKAAFTAAARVWTGLESRQAVLKR